MKPLHRLLEGNVKWHWSSECKQAFKECKNQLTSETLLVHDDHSKRLMLAYDASSYGDQFVLNGWPGKSDEIPEVFKPFLHRRYELSGEQGCVLGDARVFIPIQVSRELIRLTTLGISRYVYHRGPST